MSAASSSQTDGPAPKQDNLDPNETLKNYTKESDALYSVEFERDVPGHGPLRFRLSQRVCKCKHGRKCVRAFVTGEGWSWSEIDDSRLRVFIRVSGDPRARSFVANTHVRNGEMWGFERDGQLLVHPTREFHPVPLFCWIEQCDFDTRWNLFRETFVEPAEFGGPAGRFVLQSSDGYKFFVHYSQLAQHSPVLKRCMEANIDHIADGVPFNLQCGGYVLENLLELTYLSGCDFHLLKYNICRVVEQAHFLVMFGVVSKLAEIMRANLNGQSFERLFEWLQCAAQYDLDSNKLEVEIFKQLGVLADDQEKKDALKDQLREYNKKNPEKVVEIALDSLIK